MTITTKQVDAADALRAVADGKNVQMIWTNDGKPFFSDFTAKIKDSMILGEAFVIVEVENNKTAEKIASSQQNIADNCENAAEEIITDQEIEKNGPITVKIPNSQKEQKQRWRKIDEDNLIDMKKRGMREREIADILDVTQPTVHSHIEKLRKEGRL